MKCFCLSVWSLLEVSLFTFPPLHLIFGWPGLQSWTSSFTFQGPCLVCLHVLGHLPSWVMHMSFPFHSLSFLMVQAFLPSVGSCLFPWNYTSLIILWPRGMSTVYSQVQTQKCSIERTQRAEWSWNALWPLKSDHVGLQTQPPSPTAWHTHTTQWLSLHYAFCRGGSRDPVRIKEGMSCNTLTWCPLPREHSVSFSCNYSMMSYLCIRSFIIWSPAIPPN